MKRASNPTKKIKEERPRRPWRKNHVTKGTEDVSCFGGGIKGALVYQIVEISYRKKKK